MLKRLINFMRETDQIEPAADQWIDDMIWETIGRPEMKGKRIRMNTDDQDSGR